MNRILCIPFVGLLWTCATGLQAQDSIPAKNPPAIKLMELVLGSWQLTAVYANGKSVTAPDLLDNTRIDFGTNGKYQRVSKGANPINDSYRVNEAHGILYLEAPGATNPEEWQLAFEGDGVMILKRRGIPRLSKYKFVYKRIAEGSMKVD